MISWSTLLRVVHFIGLGMAVGSATAKLLLLWKSRNDPSFASVFLAVARPITRLIIFGSILLTASGIAWLVMGYPFSTVLVVKLVLVGALWVMGPLIDNVFEPRFRKAVSAAGPSGSAAGRAYQQYLAIEIAATLLFYVIIVMWVLA